ncbi:MAG TPA: ATP-binding protein [Polyangia bacterium]|nr:ATP-binding protein [Polyangia bacterium]
MDHNAAFVTFIREHRDDVLREWERRVRALPPAADLDTASLIDHLPHLLEEIADLADAALGGDEKAASCNQPDRHAIARLDQGYDLGHVVTEYSLLRETIQEMSAQATDAYPDALRVFNQVLDGAVRQAVERYSQASQRMLKALDRISMLALGEQDQGRLLHTLLELMMQAAPAVDEVTILLKRGNRLYVRDTVGITSERDAGFSLEVGEGFAGTVVARREPILLRSAETDPLVRSEFLRERGLKALYGVPLMDGSDVIGVAHIGSLTAYEFLDEDTFLFRAMANRASQLIIETWLKEELRVKAEELDAALDCAQLGTFHWDLRTGELRWSARARALFGLGADEPLDQERFLQLVCPEDRERVAAATRETLETGRTYRERYRILRPDGQVRHLAARGALLRENGNAVRFLGTVQDRSEEAFADRERELFLAALGHDLRSPLGAITLAAGSLLRHAAIPETAMKTVARIAYSGDRMARLIEHLLDFARARAGQQIALSRRRVDLVELWQHALDEVLLSQPDRKLTLHSDGNSVGEWDPDRLLQLFQNLVWNAVYYGDPAQPITVTVRSERDDVVVEVHNYGTSIPPDVVSVLFDPFRRGHEGGRGLGLGLYIARQIVLAHGGRIDVTSSEAAGTSFRVTLPRRPSAPSGEPSNRPG